MLHPQASGKEFVETAGYYFFHQVGFRGNQSDYYNPRNSCLIEVLAGRTGLPITLAVVYLAVAQRLSRPVHGIPLPGHFLLRYDAAAFSTLIDPFHQGRLDSPTPTGPLPTATNRQILLRMLANLRNAYYKQQQFTKAIPIMDLLIEADPSSGPS